MSIKGMPDLNELSNKLLLNTKKACIIALFATKLVSVWSCALHHSLLPMQYTKNFTAIKIENFVGKTLIFFLFLLKT